MIRLNFNPNIEQEKTERILADIRADQMGGWVELPRRIDIGELTRIKETAQKILDEAECLVCIGIGGSYLGHRAVIESLGVKSGIKIIYAGNSLSRRELEKALAELGDSDFSVLVTSKSGTTMEPKIAFDIFKEKLVEKYGDQAAQRIYAITDADKGMLHDEALKNGYTRFVVPNNVGGRYSVLSPVGLLPMAVAGIDIDELLEGATKSADPEGVLQSVRYAWMRYYLGSRGYDTEVFASFEPATSYFNEWLKQLFGESEGKDKQGIFPASVIYSTDLHSMGQFMQDGRRNLFETIVDYPTDELNQKMVSAVRTAHNSGGIPVLNIGVPSYDERGFGELIYFFEMACAVSAKLFGVNPFDQPGVEAYKKILSKLVS